MSLDKSIPASLDDGANYVVDSVETDTATLGEILAADSVLDIKTFGGGSDNITFRDTANAQDLAIISEGGPVETRNTHLNPQGTSTLSVGGANRGVTLDVGGASQTNSLWVRFDQFNGTTTGIRGNAGEVVVRDGAGNETTIS